METILLPAEQPGAIARATTVLAAGGLVVLPTETVYGLAANAANPLAVAAIFQAKDRPFFDPLIVHLPGVDWLDRLALVPRDQCDFVERLTDAFWPGPLTILLPRRPEIVPDLVTAGSALVALRVSAHPVFREVIRAFGSPLAAPSANRFGRISPTTGAHAFSELTGRIPMILEAGPTSHGLESTIVALQDGAALRVLRHGPVTAETLAGFGRVVSGTDDQAAASRSAPGQEAGHYAPRTPLTLLCADAALADFPALAQRQVGLLAFRKRDFLPAAHYARVEVLSEQGDLREAAVRLFAALRRLDEAGLDLIVAEPVPTIGLGRAIMDRLRRAAAGSGPGESVPASL